MPRNGGDRDMTEEQLELIFATEMFELFHDEIERQCSHLEPRDFIEAFLEGFELDSDDLRDYLEMEE